MPEPVRDTDAALRGIEAGQTWITNADTKIGLAMAALAVLTSAFVSRVGLVGEVFTTRPSLGWVLLGGAGLVVVLLGLAGWHLLRGLLPETAVERDNRFAWPSIRGLSDSQIAAGCSSENLLVQAWEQARCLAGIAGRKYACFTTGVLFLAAGFVVLALWIIIGVAVARPVADDGQIPAATLKDVRDEALTAASPSVECLSSGGAPATSWRPSRRLRQVPSPTDP